MLDKTKTWDDTVPPSLMPAMKALRKTFDQAHWKFGHLTQVLCYAMLHASDPKEIEDYLQPMKQAKAILGPASTQRFNELLNRAIPPAIFKAFYDFYIEGLTLNILAIFRHCVEIGMANEQSLKAPPLAWAEEQAVALIRYHRHQIENWVKSVCDKQVHDPNDISDESIFWRKWEAPQFLVMAPSRFQPYDASTAWKRRDATTSAKWAALFAEDYELHLGVRVKSAAGEVAVQLAKKPRPSPQAGARSSSEVGVASSAPVPTKSVAQEARKRKTNAKYQSWQRAYKELSKKSPKRPDVWYSREIAKTAIGGGDSPETVRKHMKK